MDNIDFYLKHIENLEEENKRLKKENEDTYKMKVRVGTGAIYSVDTQLVLPKEDYYYLPNEYKNPLKVKLVDYNVHQSVDNIIMILAAISINGNLIETNPQLLFKSKDKAGDYYLEHKEELDFSDLKYIINK